MIEHLANISSKVKNQQGISVISISKQQELVRLCHEMNLRESAALPYGKKHPKEAVSPVQTQDLSLSAIGR